MSKSDLTIAFVGCGAMGSAVLIGLLNAIYSSGNNTRTAEIFSNFIACTRTEGSAEALRKKLGCHQSRVDVRWGDIVKVMNDADVIVLGVKPYMASQVLSTTGVAQALQGKLVISMLAGISVGTLQSLCPGSGSAPNRPIYFSRAVPNLAASFRQSITIIQETETSFPKNLESLQDWIFACIGEIKHVPGNLVDLGTVLNTASMTMTSLALEGLLDGSVAMGMRRQDAMDIVLEGIRGLASILEDGTHPATMRENAASPRGCTIQTLIELEKAGIRGTYAGALIRGAEHLG